MENFIFLCSGAGTLAHQKYFFRRLITDRLKNFLQLKIWRLLLGKCDALWEDSFKKVEAFIWRITEIIN